MPASDPELLPLVDPEPLLEPELLPLPELEPLPLLDPDPLPEDEDALSAAASGLPVPALELEQLADAPAPPPITKRATIDPTVDLCMVSENNAVPHVGQAAESTRRAMGVPHPTQARTSTMAPAGQTLDRKSTRLNS